MTTKIKIAVLTIAAFGALILPVVASSRAAGFPRSAPVNQHTSALAQSEEPPPPTPLVLTDGQEQYPLGLHLEILEDPGRELTIDDVTSPEYEAQFAPSQAQVPNYGFTDSAYWVRFRLRNESQLTDHALLELGFANMQFADLYLPQGETYTARQTGALLPFDTRDIANRHIVFDLLLPPGETLTFHIRFQSGASMTLPLTVWYPFAFFAASTAELFLLGIFYGVFLIMLVYNLFLLYALRETTYLYFIYFLASGILLFASYDGIAAQYIWPGRPVINRFAVPIFYIIFLASITRFADAFLELRERAPLFHRLVSVALAGWGVALILALFISYQLLATVWVPWGVFSLGLAMAAGLACWRRGYLPARYFLFSWVGLLTGLPLLFLVRLGVIASTSFTEQFFRLGILWMIAFWAIALADRIDLLKTEKEKADLGAQASEARYRQLVETMNDGLGVIDEHGRLTYANNRLAAMLGFTPEEMIGKSAADFTDEVNRQILARQGELRKTGVSTPYELTWLTKDASEVITLISPMPLFEEGGRYTGSVVVVTDITERVQASRLLEQRVEERTRELSTLLDISRDIAASRDLSAALQRILERLKNVVDYHGLAILAEERGNWKILAQDWPAAPGAPEQIELSAAEVQAMVKDLAPGAPVLITSSAPGVASGNGIGAITRKLSGGHDPAIRYWLGVPLLEKGSVFGAMLLGCEQAAASEDQVKVIVASANQVAVAIENNRLYRQIREAVMAEERNRLARDLHDSVTQTLFSVSLLADVLPQIWRRDAEQGLQRLEKLRRLARGALAEMRTMLLELRPSAVINTPLADLLAQLTEAIASRSGLPFQLYLEQTPSLPEEVQVNFYRIAQEALNNVVKHAQAKLVTVSLSAAQAPADSAKTEVRMVIQDDGVGFSAGGENSTRMGIGIMRERAAAIGASLSLGSRLGHGTQVTLLWRSVTENRS